jgi:hypothetical protein
MSEVGELDVAHDVGLEELYQRLVGHADAEGYRYQASRRFPIVLMDQPAQSIAPADRADARQSTR